MENATLEESQVQNDKPIPTGEPTVQFFMYTDLAALQVKNPDLDELLAEISGYDLRVRFNFKYIKSLHDVEVASAAIGDIFKRIMLEQLLGDNKPEQSSDTIK